MEDTLNLLNETLDTNHKSWDEISRELLIVYIGALLWAIKFTLKDKLSVNL